MYDVIAEEDKWAFSDFMGLTPLDMSLQQTPCRCCGIINRDMFTGSRANKYVHAFLRTDSIVEELDRNRLVIPDKTGNLILDWDDV